jgi:glycosyltransferase involved in cell wall biosynthesis
MKVLIVDHNAIGAGDRGLWRALNAPPQVEVVLVVPRVWSGMFGTAVYEPEKSTLRVVPSDTFFDGKSHRVIYRNLPRILAVEKPDVVYVNSEPEGFLAWQVVSVLHDMKTRPKFVFDSWRNIDHTNLRFPYKLSLLNRMAERTVLRFADHGVVHNESALNIYTRMGFDRLTVIPPHVERSLSSPADPQEKRQIFTIGYVGRFVPLKGVDVLLDAAARLRCEWRLVLVGDGSARETWSAKSDALGIRDKIEWRKPVRHDEIPRILGSLDVLVLPSRTGDTWKEQFGRVLIEAMACGVPVIGSDSGEIPAVIRDAGIVFKEGDANELADALTSLQSNSGLRTRLKERGCELVCSEHSIDVVVEKYRSLFNGLASRR